ncbi:glycoside hydrolase family 3 C-terminal domain-containing protein, partial [Ruminococcus flavefaciens]|uniref:glycoside hydrolase family 3 C-terminal domain-containing protein n=1 Tax=Ruminococcus flavefaciens TaxID=1265 RepID=UPI0026F0B61F
GALGLDGNSKARQEAKELGKPTVACIVAGRQVLINPRIYDQWDSVVMCYLPGSEGKGISDVLCGCADFTGKLPSPWYSSLDQIRTDNCWLERGYGLSYGGAFKAKAEPETILDPPTKVEPDPAIAGTNYTPGLFKDGVYVNDYAKIKINVPGNLNYFPYTLEEKEEDIAALTDEEDIIRETSRTIDGVFANAKETVDVIYVNTKLAFPDAENVTVEMILDDYKAWIEKFFISDDAECEWKERIKVKLGEEEFTRDLVYYDENCFDAIYMKKLDDDLMCWIYTSTCLPERTPEYYEALFK